MAAGLMSSVLEKIAALMGEHYEKHKSMQREVGFLKDELGSMNAVIRKLADMEEELDSQTKEWRNQIMDMAFDIEDCIDEFTHQVGINSISGGVGFMGRITQYVHELRASYKFTEQIQQLKTRVEEVSERRKRYKLDECFSSSSNIAVDTRVTALYVEAANIIGLEGPKEEITKLLSNEEGALVQSLRVVSIVGFGGLGKTTLANEVYRNVGGQYNCKAFVSVSQKPDMMKLLSMIISKVGMPMPTLTYEVQDLINNLREYLGDKRYFLVIDDIWEESAWNILRCAFPDNKKGSKIITTTRIQSVAKASCNYQNEFIYKVKLLNIPNSRKLFFSRVGHVSLESFRGISDEILQRCGAVPLSIIIVASLLTSQPTTTTGQWKYICRSLSPNFRTNPVIQVLKLSYNDLPHELKACLLYIGIYPEDYPILKQDVVSLWLAEGLVTAIDGRDVEEVASGYFNEVINRSLIQPSVLDDYGGEMLYCKVHDMILLREK